MQRKTAPRTVMRKKMKMSRVTDMYQTNTLRKLGQMGKHVQKRKPTTRRVVIMLLKDLSPS
jgi:hypothetical protein